MNNFIQHVTGQLVWLGEHRGLFLLLIVELFAGARREGKIDMTQQLDEIGNTEPSMFLPTVAEKAGK